MSVVTVQVGQCGNQLGASLFNTLHQHCTFATARGNNNDDPSRSNHDGHPSAPPAAAAACRRSFFRNNGRTARAVIVDTEPKVIQQIVADAGKSVRDDGAQQSRYLGREAGGGGRGQPGGGATGQGGWSYDSGTQVCCHAQGGAANNWAYGYHGHGSR
ncbi:unnamed protein product [Sphacelaria rigidula]